MFTVWPKWSGRSFGVTAIADPWCTPILSDTGRSG
jgi:hypothetical protein